MGSVKELENEKKKCGLQAPLKKDWHNKNMKYITWTWKLIVIRHNDGLTKMVMYRIAIAAKTSCKLWRYWAPSFYSLRSSSFEVVFHWGRLPLWASSIEVVFHCGRLPLVVFFFVWCHMICNIQTAFPANRNRHEINPTLSRLVARASQPDFRRAADSVPGAMDRTIRAPDWQDWSNLTGSEQPPPSLKIGQDWTTTGPQMNLS